MGCRRNRDHDLVDVVFLRQAADIVPGPRHRDAAQIFSLLPRIIVYQAAYILFAEPAVLKLFQQSIARFPGAYDHGIFLPGADQAFSFLLNISQYPVHKPEYGDSESQDKKIHERITSRIIQMHQPHADRLRHCRYQAGNDNINKVRSAGISPDPLVQPEGIESRYCNN